MSNLIKNNQIVEYSSHPNGLERILHKTMMNTGAFMVIWTLQEFQDGTYAAFHRHTVLDKTIYAEELPFDMVKRTDWTLNVFGYYDRASRTMTERNKDWSLPLEDEVKEYILKRLRLLSDNS